MAAGGGSTFSAAGASLSSPPPNHPAPYPASASLASPPAAYSEPFAITLSARQLRLFSPSASQASGQAVAMIIQLLPSSLRLPSLTTPAIAVRTSDAINLDYDGRLTFTPHGHVHEHLRSIFTSTSPVSTHGPGPLALKLSLTLTSQGVVRTIGSANVPLGPYLFAAAAPHPPPPSPTALLNARGSVVAEVTMAASAPEVLASLAADRAQAPAFEVRRRVRGRGRGRVRGRDAGGGGGGVRAQGWPPALEASLSYVTPYPGP